MNKASAMRRVNGHLGHELLRNANTRFSSINDTRSRPVPVWWFTLAPDLLMRELHLLLAKDPGLIWLMIDANTFVTPDSLFKKRVNGKIDLEICCEVEDRRYLRDIRSGGAGYNFLPHLKHEFPS